MTNPADTADFFSLLHTARAVRVWARARAATISPTSASQIAMAVEIAKGRRPKNRKLKIVGAEKDLNARGRGTISYRMVHRLDGWQYVSAERLPSGSFLAAERRAKVFGVVYSGEIVASHERGGPLDVAWLAVGGIVGVNPTDPKWAIKITMKRVGSRLLFTLPDGTCIDAPNPR